MEANKKPRQLAADQHAIAMASYVTVMFETDNNLISFVTVQ